MIIDVFVNHHLGHGDQHGGVGARFDGYPLLGQRFGRWTEAWVHADYFCPGLFGQGQVGRRIWTKTGDQRVPAPHNNQFGVKQIIAGVAGKSGTQGGARCKSGGFMDVLPLMTLQPPFRLKNRRAAIPVPCRAASLP